MDFLHGKQLYELICSQVSNKRTLCSPQAIYNKSAPRYRRAIISQALGLLHSRTNLSPFTKDFRGESQQNEHLGKFF